MVWRIKKLRVERKMFKSRLRCGCQFGVGSCHWLFRLFWLRSLFRVGLGVRTGFRVCWLVVLRLPLFLLELEPLAVLEILLIVLVQRLLLDNKRRLTDPLRSISMNGFLLLHITGSSSLLLNRITIVSHGGNV